MTNTYNITFKYSETTYCSNIALGTEEQIRKHYSDYEILSLTEATGYEMEEAQRKGKPVIDCTSEQPEQATETTEQEESTIEETKDNYEALKDIFRKMDDSDIISVWNEYTYSQNLCDDEILDYDSLMEVIENSGKDTITWLNRFYFGSDDYSKDGSANPNRNYFTFNGYGNIISFDYIYNQYSDEFNYIEIGDLIDYILSNNDSLYNDEIQEFLDEMEEETEEE